MAGVGGRGRTLSNMLGEDLFQGRFKMSACLLIVERFLLQMYKWWRNTYHTHAVSCVCRNSWFNLQIFNRNPIRSKIETPYIARRLIRDVYLGVRVLSSKPTYHKACNKPYHATRGLLNMIGLIILRSRRLTRMFLFSILFSLVEFSVQLRKLCTVTELSMRGQGYVLSTYTHPLGRWKCGEICKP